MKGILRRQFLKPGFCCTADLRDCIVVGGSAEQAVGLCLIRISNHAEDFEKEYL